jgi:hypothetical protein
MTTPRMPSYLPYSLTTELSYLYWFGRDAHEVALGQSKPPEDENLDAYVATRRRMSIRHGRKVELCLAHMIEHPPEPAQAQKALEQTARTMQIVSESNLDAAIILPGIFAQAHRLALAGARHLVPEVADLISGRLGPMRRRPN